MTPAQRLRAASDPDFWHATAPALHISDTPTPLPPSPLPHRQLREEGWTSIPGAVPAELCARLTTALQCLHDAHIPTPFLYVYDEAWAVSAALGATFDALVGGPAWLWPDVWAWLLPPPRDSGANIRGWAPHRGVTYDVRDPMTGAPTLVNAWVALSDVTLETACMHVVPLGVDPHYPHALDRLDVDPALAVPLPVPPGTLLGWSANTLHWGGAMSAKATSPRASLSFTVGRDPTPGGFRPDRPPAFPARVDLVADMLLTYEAADHAADAADRADSAEWLRWAELARGMRVMRDRFK